MRAECFTQQLVGVKMVPDERVTITTTFGLDATALLHIFSRIRLYSFQPINDEAILSPPGSMVCQHLGSGIKFDTAETYYNYGVVKSTMWALKSDLLIWDGAATDLLSKDEATTFTSALGLKRTDDDLQGTVYIDKGTMSTFDINKSSICGLTPFLEKIGYLRSQILSNLEFLWKRYVTIYKILSKSEVVADTLFNCLGTTTFESVLQKTDQQLTDCIKLASTVRKKRSSLLSYLLSDGKQQDMIQNSLHETILKYNTNFHTLESVSNELGENLYNLQRTTNFNLETMEKELLLLRYSLKIESNLEAARVSLMEELLVLNELIKRPSNQHLLRLIHDFLLGRGTFCDQTECVEGGSVEVQDGKVRLHFRRQKMKASPVYMITCAPLDDTYIPVFHQSRVEGNNSSFSYLGHTFLLQQLSNETFLASNKRRIQDNDLILGNIVLIENSTKVAATCIKDDILVINETSHKCKALEIFPLPKGDFRMINPQGIFTSTELSERRVNINIETMQEGVEDNLETWHESDFYRALSSVW